MMNYFCLTNKKQFDSNFHKNVMGKYFFFTLKYHLIYYFIAFVTQLDKFNPDNDSA